MMVAVMRAWLLSLTAAVLVACSGANGALDLPPSDDAAAGDGGAGEGAPGGDADAEVPTGPRAFLSAEGVDFGRADCGGAAPAGKKVTVTNRGGAPLTWSASLASAVAATFAI